MKTSHALDAGAAILTAVLSGMLSHPVRPQELTADALDAIRVVPGQPKPPPPIGDYSYVEVVGCLTRGARDTWLLTQASEPVVASAASSSSSAAPVVKPLGTQTLRLLDAIA